MIARNFYRFAEVTERLGIDAETLRQAVISNKVALFLLFKQTRARMLTSDPKDIDIKSDPYCAWIFAEEDDGGEEGHVIATERFIYSLSGSYRGSGKHARHAGFQSAGRPCPFPRYGLRHFLNGPDTFSVNGP